MRPHNVLQTLELAGSSGDLGSLPPERNLSNSPPTQMGKERPEGSTHVLRLSW